MHFPDSFRPLWRWFYASGAILFWLSLIIAPAARAQLSLDVLRRDGYGSVPITRPEPNTLLVVGSVNGHAAKFVLDTGAGWEGVVMENAFARALGISGEKLKDPARSFTGRS